MGKEKAKDKKDKKYKDEKQEKEKKEKKAAAEAVADDAENFSFSGMLKKKIAEKQSKEAKPKPKDDLKSKVKEKKPRDEPVKEVIAPPSPPVDLGPPLCPQGHMLKPWASSQDGTCDGCGGNVDEAEKVFDCRECDWYLCMACVELRSKPEKDKQSEAKKESEPEEIAESSDKESKHDKDSSDKECSDKESNPDEKASSEKDAEEGNDPVQAEVPECAKQAVVDDISKQAEATKA